MKKFMLLAAAMILCSCLTNSAWAGKKDTKVSEERKVAYFESFAAAGSFDVRFIQSDVQKVIVEGKEEFVKKLRTEVKGKTLILKMEKGNYHNLVLNVTVYAPMIDGIDICGSGDVLSDKIIVPGKELEFSVSGSGDITVNEIQCEELDIEIAGSGDVKVGKATVDKEIELSVSGSGDIAINGQCHKVEATVAGSGDISGNLKYAEIKKRVAGSGSIRF